MAYESVADLSTDNVSKIGGFNEKSQKPNPTKMEGFYLGSRTVTTSNGTSVIHVFQTPTGNEGVWGTADLNTKLGSVTLGNMTLITYQGKKKLAGGKTKHTYLVQQDPEQSISVPKPSASQAASFETEYAEEEETEDNSADEDDAQAAALLVAEQREAARAKVQAMLNKNKAK